MGLHFSYIQQSGTSQESISLDMQTSIQVSIVIPVLNQIDKVQSCLDALLQQDFPRDQLEIIVIDNGSTDGTWNI
ncbi:MAG: glycosyltransferase [Saprospiraceae bacterium]|nr:glycosyltransferase [Saprospiraceae bacterium]